MKATGVPRMTKLRRSRFAEVLRAVTALPAASRARGVRRIGATKGVGYAGLTNCER